MAAHDIFPLLMEPTHSISLELEVLARHQHPDLTVPVLKALDEIVKASRQETHSITQKSLEFSSHIKSETQHLKERNQNLLSVSSALSSSISSGSGYRDLGSYFWLFRTEWYTFSTSYCQRILVIFDISPSSKGCWQRNQNWFFWWGHWTNGIRQFKGCTGRPTSWNCDANCT